MRQRESLASLSIARTLGFLAVLSITGCDLIAGITDHELATTSGTGGSGGTGAAGGTMSTGGTGGATGGGAGTGGVGGTGGTGGSLELVPAAEISAGTNHACATLIDGTARCWGDGRAGQLGGGATDVIRTRPVAVGGGQHFDHIAAGAFHTCGFVTGGDVFCWGWAASGQVGVAPEQISVLSPSVVSMGNEKAKAIASGREHTCAIVGAGDVLCWGSDVFGELGDGGAISVGTGTPTPVDLLGEKADLIVARGRTTCVRLVSGKVMCWGNHGILPVEIQGMEGAAQLAIGERVDPAHEKIFARMPDGSVLWVSADFDLDTPAPYAFGGTATAISAASSLCLVLSDGNTKCTALPDDAIPPGSASPVPGLAAAAIVSTDGGWKYNCGRTAMGSVKCWGDNTLGQLGNGEEVLVPRPYLVPGISAAATLAVGQVSSAVVLSDGTIKGWGNLGAFNLTSTTPASVAPTATSLLLGIGENGAQDLRAYLSDGGVLSQVKMGGMNPGSGLSQYAAQEGATFKAAHPGELHDIGLTSTGKVIVFAPQPNGNDHGFFGDALSTSLTGTVFATQVVMTGITNRADVETACAWTDSGAGYCWGENAIGQAGVDPANAATADPTIVFNDAKWMATNGRTTCAVKKSNGAVFCWGQNDRGQISNGSIDDTHAPTAVGLNGAAGVTLDDLGTVCAWTDAKDVYCWGFNEVGEAGNGRFAPVAEPTKVEGITDVVSMDSGQAHMCARTSEGKVYCWGDSYWGCVGNGAPNAHTDAQGVVGIGKP